MGGKESSSKNGERTFNPFSMRSSSIQFLKGKKKKKKRQVPLIFEKYSY